MNFDMALNFLESLRPKNFHLELGPMIDACRIFADPQMKFPSVHVGGTNGKGSTSAFLSAILLKSGYRVGLFTSPHLLDVRERIQINGRMISKADFVRILSNIKSKLPDERMLSYFEMLCLVSFLYFTEKNIDIAVYETGLGGRLDATNILSPEVAVLTPISFDHTQHLGTSLREIAVEKCGIIKQGVPTVVAYQVPDVMDAIRRACDDTGSPLCLAMPDEVKYPLGLSGEHQRQNAACAIEAANILSTGKFSIHNVDIALASVKWPGRLEIISKKPNIILDGAHNVAGAEAVASYVRSNIPKEKAVLLIGILSSKDVAGIARTLAPYFREIISTNAPSDKAASPKDIAAAARSFCSNVEIIEDIPTALSTLSKRLGKDDSLVIAGSLTVVGEAKRHFEGLNHA